MHDPVAYRAHLRELAERLIVEHTATLPPGQVMSIVYRAARMVVGVPEEHRLVTCTAVVRTLLNDRLALLGSATLSATG